MRYGGGGGLYWGDYFIVFFHVSEHIDHLKQEKNHQEKTGNSLVLGYSPPSSVKNQTFSVFFI